MDRDAAKTHDRPSSFYFPPLTPDAVQEDAAVQLGLTPRVESTLSERLDVLVKLGTVLALIVPVGVALWVGYNLPSDVRDLKARVAALEGGQSVLIALACSERNVTRFEALQLRCDAAVLAVQQAGAPRP
jgi:hypothetical protein